jgi:hypothetical protein
MTVCFIIKLLLKAVISAIMSQSASDLSTNPFYQPYSQKQLTQRSSIDATLALRCGNYCMTSAVFAFSRTRQSTRIHTRQPEIAFPIQRGFVIPT